MNMFVNVILILAAGVFGFFLGRFSVHRILEDMIGETQEGEAIGERRRSARRTVSGVEKYNLGSPVSGMVTESDAGECPVVVIRPENGKVYAPAGGRVKRVYPGGNEILFVTEFGTEMHISVGDVRDDLLERYYRPRVIQNEVVSRGKLLLEFDEAGLLAEGSTADVFLRMENLDGDTDVELAGMGQVKAGEPIVKIY